MRNWLLPEFVEDVLPDEARAIETYRSRLLELFRVHGYELVVPPLLEHIESLLSGTGHDLDLRTFKLIDQLSGRTMGLRADMTPQVARIDAHLLNRDGVARLCYCGSILHTRPRSLTATREPLQIGAEIYGHAGHRKRHRDPAAAARGARGVRPRGRSPGCRARRRVPGGGAPRRGGRGAGVRAARGPGREGPRRARRAQRRPRRRNARRAPAAARAVRRRRSAGAGGGRAPAATRRSLPRSPISGDWCARTASR